MTALRASPKDSIKNSMLGEKMTCQTLPPFYADISMNSTLGMRRPRPQNHQDQLQLQSLTKYWLHQCRLMQQQMYSQLRRMVWR